MAVKVQIPAPMRQHTEGKTCVDASGSTVQAVLADLGVKFPSLGPRLLENGQVRRFVNLYLNNEDVRYLENLATPVKDGDELAIIPAVAGG
jgi:molybdopterin converting factor small subunit